MGNRTTRSKLEEAQLNREVYIEQMSKWDDKKLVKHMDLFRKQMEMAYRQNNREAYELLYEYESQVAEARLTKFDREVQKKNQKGKPIPTL